MKLEKIFFAMAALCFFCALSGSQNGGAVESLKSKESFKTAGEGLTLERTIQMALDVNLDLKVSALEVDAARAVKKSSRALFFPSFGATYQYKRLYEPSRSELTWPGGTSILLNDSPINNNSFVASATQTIFAGFALKNQYLLAGLGLEAAQAYQRLAKREVIYKARDYFFSALKAKKIFEINAEAVALLTAHHDVAESFYNVGMTPLNDLLKAKVELANANLNFVMAKNALAMSESAINALLRRPINTPAVIRETTAWTPFEKSLDHCLSVAKKRRLEIELADLKVKMAQKKLGLSKADFAPSIGLTFNYYQFGDDWDANGGRGVSDPSMWDISLSATWTFWEWGKTYFDVKEKRCLMLAAKNEKQRIIDDIFLEVKQAYLKTKESEKNIATVEKAVEQAKENFRISEERYKEQMATSTDVLDARTLLSTTMTNYYTALYDFNISKASLHRAMDMTNDGQETGQ